MQSSGSTTPGALLTRQHWRATLVQAIATSRNDAEDVKTLASLQRLDFWSALAFDSALEEALVQVDQPGGLEARLDNVFDHHIRVAVEHAERHEEYLSLLSAVATKRCPASFLRRRPEYDTLQRSLTRLGSGQNDIKRHHRDGYASVIAVGKAWGFDKLRRYEWTQRGDKFMAKLRTCSKQWPKWEEAAVVISRFGVERLDVCKADRRDPREVLEPQDIRKACEFTRTFEGDRQRCLEVASETLSEYSHTLDAFGLLDYSRPVCYLGKDFPLQDDVSTSSDSDTSRRRGSDVFGSSASPSGSRTGACDTPATEHSGARQHPSTPACLSDVVSGADDLVEGLQRPGVEAAASDVGSTIETPAESSDTEEAESSDTEEAESSDTEEAESSDAEEATAATSDAEEATAATTPAASEAQVTSYPLRFATQDSSEPSNQLATVETDHAVKCASVPSETAAGEAATETASQLMGNSRRTQETGPDVSGAREDITDPDRSRGHPPEGSRAQDDTTDPSDTNTETADSASTHKNTTTSPGAREHTQDLNDASDARTELTDSSDLTDLSGMSDFGDDKDTETDLTDSIRSKETPELPERTRQTPAPCSSEAEETSTASDAAQQGAVDPDTAEGPSLDPTDTRQVPPDPANAGEHESNLGETEDEDASECVRDLKLEETWQAIAGDRLRSIRHAMLEATTSGRRGFVQGRTGTKRQKLSTQDSDIDVELLRTGLHWLGDIQYARTNKSLQFPNAGDVLVVHSSKDFLAAAESTRQLHRCVLIRERTGRGQVKRYLDEEQPLPSIDDFFEEMLCRHSTHGEVNVQAININETSTPTDKVKIGKARTIFQERADCQEYRRALNLLDLRSVVSAGAPAFLRHKRYGALTHILEGAGAGPGKHEGNPMSDSDMLSRCRSFNILALGGAFSGPHVDVLNGTWVRCLDGIKAWLINPKMSDQDRRDFAMQGRVWKPSTPTKIVVLQKGDVLVMPPGMLAVHAPLTLTPCLMEGGMFWDWRHLDRIFEHVYWIYDNSDVTNEDLSATMLDQLLEHAISMVNPRNTRSVHGNKAMKQALDAIYRRRAKK